MGIYADPADVENYIIGGTGLEGDEVEKRIGFAEFDVDRATGSPFMALDNGRKFDVTIIPSGFAQVLKDATCAQVEYALQMGDEFFVAHQYENQSSPDFSATGKVPRFGPKMLAHLDSVGLRVKTARATH